MKRKTQDTIVAQISAVGNAPVSIVKVSGSNSKKILKQLTLKKEFKPGKIYYGKIYNEESSIDDTQFVFYKNPKSYTGEDSFEIFCHGNQLIVKKIIKEIIKNGAKIAEGGEFTKRAFLNNKIDILQAEAVSDLISAENEIALKAAIRNREGALSKEINGIRKNIVSLLCHAELEIDFNEENIEIYTSQKTRKIIEKTIIKINRLIDGFDISKKVKEGIKICICGDVNVGKSTIFNLLVNQERAIVTDIPGTTRDVISETAIFSDNSITVYDTAGIRDLLEGVEAQGIKRAKEKIRQADIVILIADAEREETIKKIEAMENMEKNRSLYVINKKDLNPGIKVKNKEKNKRILIISAKKEGVGQIKSEIERIIRDEIDTKTMYLVNERQYYNLKMAKKYLIKSKDVIEKPDLFAYEIKMVCEEIENLMGEIKSEEVLNEIFKNFCIGK